MQDAPAEAMQPNYILQTILLRTIYYYDLRVQKGIIYILCSLLHTHAHAHKLTQAHLAKHLHTHV